MRARSNSGVRLDYYQRMVQKTILKYQHQVTGLLPSIPGHPHAWVRDNIYSILCVWGLAMAYKKNMDLDEDRAIAYELQQSVVKLMRGLLFAMMKQMHKVERFKLTQDRESSLHAKFSVATADAVVGDREWGHLQIDATSLYLLMLAEMTASGLTIIFDLDEVAFIQNLVFYIQSAYRTPDYGIWERGDKNNHGMTELNCSSIGMAKAALEALNDLDLFGSRGGPSSVIHVMPDEAVQCRAIIHSVLPRESISKETDAALLSVISYPAFAVDDPLLIETTRDTLIEKLQGRYGLCRFLRDGYKTAKEDPNRLHYWPAELANFEHIECEWPMFFAYLMLDALFNGRTEQAQDYCDRLESIMKNDEDGMKCMPEIYVVSMDKVEQEKRLPKSQDRVASGKMPQMWGQSLYILGKLLLEGFISPGEVDPLNRRLTAESKPDIVVQVVIVAESKEIQEKLSHFNIDVQTAEEMQPIQAHPASVLGRLLAYLGRNDKLKMSGRPPDSVGVLATSKLYTLGNVTLAFYPQMVDNQQFYLTLDPHLFTDLFKSDLQYVAGNWRMLGRPTVIFPVQKSILDVHDNIHPALIATIRKLQGGYLNGARVKLGRLSEFLSTSCITDLTFLTETEESPGLSRLLEMIATLSLEAKARTTQFLHTQQPTHVATRSRRRSSVSVRGMAKRSCSIQVENMEGTSMASLDLLYAAALRRSTLTPDLGGPIEESCEEQRIDSSEDVGQGRGVFRPYYDGTEPTTPDADQVAPFSPAINIGAPRFGTGHPHLRGQSVSEDPDELYDFEESQFSGVPEEDLVHQLADSSSLHEQADIIHYLMIKKGEDWDTQMGGKSCTVKELLVELYEKAGHAKQWFLVRHTAGMLKKQVEDLAKAATDIIVRQKQLAVGLPPEPREKIILKPLPPDELVAVIREAHSDDMTTAMLTQEILIYLALFIRTEPKLFNEMLRIRVGLIIQVMATELARTLHISGDEASDQLLNLSPYEMKTLLHHILSGKEFTVKVDDRCLTIVPMEVKSRTTSRYSKKRAAALSAAQKIVLDRVHDELSKAEDDLHMIPAHLEGGTSPALHEEADRHGQWLRRRRLDGALNRVPLGFYTSMWNVLQRCPGLSIEGHFLPQNLTREMTPGEFKFALHLEMVLNKIPYPEYRQLMVEAMIILIQIVEHDNGKTHWNDVIHVEKLVHAANDLFIEEQRHMDGDVTLCCGIEGQDHGNPLRCGGNAGICLHFYDTAPSGKYGTMSYLCRAALTTLQFPITTEGNLDCNVS